MSPGHPARGALPVAGVLHELEPRLDDPVDYTLVIGSHRISLDALFGTCLEIAFAGVIVCQACGAATARSYGTGYCYRCFTTLARCDLCVVSPARCHFAAGTCREPDWGIAFCMQTHIVYLANTSGAKVGITRQGAEIGRWLDQGAVQGLAIASAMTRHLAGLLEVRLARTLSDRTDWRRLTSRDAVPIDLEGLRARITSEIDASGDPLPAGLAWLAAPVEVRIRYPVRAYSPRRQLRLARGGTCGGVLTGIKGQYLLFDTGVFNVRRHRGCEVTMRRLETPVPRSASSQFELF